MIDDDDNCVDDNADADFDDAYADVDADENEEIPASTTTFSLVKSDLGSIIISIFSRNCQKIYGFLLTSQLLFLLHMSFFFFVHARLI